MIGEILRNLFSPALCRLGWHRWFDTEKDVPKAEAGDGWFLPAYGKGTPIRLCYWCQKEAERR